MADQLVQSIVPADVLAGGSYASRLVAPDRTVRGAGAVLKGHGLLHLRHGALQRIVGYAQAVANGAGRVDRLLQAFGAAQPAAGAAGEVAPLFLQARETARGHRHGQLESAFAPDLPDREQIVRSVDDALGQAEAQGEILELRGRRHHDHVGSPIVGQGRRHLGHDPVGVIAACARPPPAHIRFGPVSHDRHPGNASPRRSRWGRHAAEMTTSAQHRRISGACPGWPAGRSVTARPRKWSSAPPLKTGSSPPAARFPGGKTGRR